jgi:hypothetical protein
VCSSDLAAAPGAAAPGAAVVAASEAQAPRAGVLTAASVADADRRANYLEYLARHADARDAVGLDMTQRVRLRAVDAQRRPVFDAVVRVSDGEQRVVASGRTHADGTWDYYPAVWGAAASSRALSATVTAASGERATVTLDVPAPGADAEREVVVRGAAATPPRALDLAFAIDATGSMGDELRYVARELADVVARVRVATPELTVRVGAVFYRDRADAQPLGVLPFTTDVGVVARALQGVVASGGGDYPEDMNRGLAAAFNDLAWRDDAGTDRVLVVFADAPPHAYSDAQYTYHDALRAASARGVRVLPVAASGADRTVEYLFRAMGAFTSTPYVYLTDDSGVGGAHLEADTDRVGVERFNDLLVRLIASDLRGEGMHEPGRLGVHAG